MALDRFKQVRGDELTVRRVVEAAWRRMTAIPHDLAYRVRAGPSSDNAARIRALAGRHQGHRCFVLGNGPSLARMDLAKIAGEYSFGLNRIFLLFDQTSFRPTYYVCMNGLVLAQSAREISRLPMPRLLNWRYRRHFPKEERVIYLRESFRPHFSIDPMEGVWSGATVTFVALQLAYHLGFSQVVLLGVDHHYERQGTPHSTVVGQAADPDHFHPDYFPQGFRWQLPDLRTSELAYAMAKEAFERNGRRIVDATAGGKLNVFPKVEFEAIIG